MFDFCSKHAIQLSTEQNLKTESICNNECWVSDSSKRYELI